MSTATTRFTLTVDADGEGIRRMAASLLIDGTPQRLAMKRARLLSEDHFFAAIFGSFEAIAQKIEEGRAR